MFWYMNNMYVHKIYRVSAEKFLESVEQNQNYGLLLLHLLDKEDVALHVRVSGAIAFKNYVKRNWRVVRPVTFCLTYYLNLFIETGCVLLMYTAQKWLFFYVFQP